MRSEEKLRLPRFQFLDSRGGNQGQICARHSVSVCQSTVVFFVLTDSSVSSFVGLKDTQVLSLALPDRVDTTVNKYYTSSGAFVRIGALVRIGNSIRIIGGVDIPFP